MRFRPTNVLDRLARHGIRQKTDEIARVSRPHGDADLAVVFHAADARAVPGARIEDDERALVRFDGDARGRRDARENVVDGFFQLPPVAHELPLEGQDVRRDPLRLFFVNVAALAEDVEKQHRPLEGVAHVVEPGIDRACRLSFRHGRLPILVDPGPPDARGPEPV